MGYSTDFIGCFKFNKPVTIKLQSYINKFSYTRRMIRDNEKIKALYPDWQKKCFNGLLGVNGEYFIGDECDNDKSIIDYNDSGNQPGLWCQWIINDDEELVWDGGEKFYNYVEWLEYLIEHFFAPSGYVLSGEVKYQGEDYNDFGKIVVEDNMVQVLYGEKHYGI